MHWLHPKFDFNDSSSACQRFLYASGLICGLTFAANWIANFSFSHSSDTTLQRSKCSRGHARKTLAESAAPRV
jgi:hypothetical protein